jgi:guanylate kinase
MTTKANPNQTRRRGSIIVISAPSGSGKTTLVKRLLAALPGLEFSISYTTRPPRHGEKDGRDYYFVSRREFRRMIADQEFLEWAEIVGHLYGTATKQLRAAQDAGEDILLDIDVQGHEQLRQKLPEAVSIFILPPSYQELERRLRRRRSDAPEVIERRLNNSRREIQHWAEYDYLVVNDRLTRATRALRAIVEAARSRRQVQEESAQEISQTFGG